MTDDAPSDITRKAPLTKKALFICASIFGLLLVFGAGFIAGANFITNLTEEDEFDHHIDIAARYQTILWEIDTGKLEEIKESMAAEISSLVMIISWKIDEMDKEDIALACMAFQFIGIQREEFKDLYPSKTETDEQANEVLSQWKNKDCNNL